MTVQGLALFLFLLVGLPLIGQQKEAPVPADQEIPAVASPPDTPAPDLTRGRDGKISQEQMRQLCRGVADKDIESEKRHDDYTYMDREVEHKLDGKGQTKSTEVKTYEILEIYGAPVHGLIEKNR